MPGLVPGILLFWGPFARVADPSRRLLAQAPQDDVGDGVGSAGYINPRTSSRGAVERPRLEGWAARADRRRAPCPNRGDLRASLRALLCLRAAWRDSRRGHMDFPGICGRYRRNTAGLRLNLTPARLHSMRLPPISPRFRAARRDRACRGGSRMLPTISDPNILQGMGGSRQERTQNAQDEDQIGRQKAL